MSALDLIVHDGWVAWTTRHRAELAAWAVREKAAIAELGEFHRRGIAQNVRQARIRLIARSGDWPAMGDPDFIPIIQAKRNLAFHRMLSKVNPLYVADFEQRLRVAADQPLPETWRTT